MTLISSQTVPIITLKHVNHSVKRCLITLKSQFIDHIEISVRKLGEELDVSQKTATETLRILRNPDRVKMEFWGQQTKEKSNSNSCIPAINIDAPDRLTNLEDYLLELFNQSSSIFKKINEGAASSQDRDACILIAATLLLYSNRLGEVTNLKFSDLEKILSKSKDSVRRYLKQLRQMKIVNVLFTGENSKDFAQRFYSVYQVNLNSFSSVDCEYEQRNIYFDSNVFSSARSMFSNFRLRKSNIDSKLLQFMGNLYKSQSKSSYLRFLHSFINICIFETLNLQTKDISPLWITDIFRYFSPEPLYKKNKDNLTQKELNYKIGQIPDPIKVSFEKLYRKYNVVLERHQNVHELSVLLLHLSRDVIREISHILMSDPNINTKEVQNPEMFSLYIGNERIFADRNTKIRLRIHNSLLAPDDSSVG